MTAPQQMREWRERLQPAMKYLHEKVEETDYAGLNALTAILDVSLQLGKQLATPSPTQQPSEELLGALCDYRPSALDDVGTFVTVSRQALDEAIEILTSLVFRPSQEAGKIGEDERHTKISPDSVAVLIQRDNADEPEKMRKGEIDWSIKARPSSVEEDMDCQYCGQRHSSVLGTPCPPAPSPASGETWRDAGPLAGMLEQLLQAVLDDNALAERRLRDELWDHKVFIIRALEYIAAALTPPAGRGEGWTCGACGARITYGWQQLQPVVRFLCPGCAEEDQRVTHPAKWHGIFYPAIEQKDLR